MDVTAMMLARSPSTLLQPRAAASITGSPNLPSAVPFLFSTAAETLLQSQLPSSPPSNPDLWRRRWRAPTADTGGERLLPRRRRASPAPAWPRATQAAAAPAPHPCRRRTRRTRWSHHRPPASAQSRSPTPRIRRRTRRTRWSRHRPPAAAQLRSPTPRIPSRRSRSSRTCPRDSTATPPRRPPSPPPQLRHDGHHRLRVVPLGPRGGFAGMAERQAPRPPPLRQPTLGARPTHRPDEYVVPEEYVTTMRESMLKRCPVSTYEEVCGVFAKDLGESPETVFAEVLLLHKSMMPEHTMGKKLLLRFSMIT